MSHSFYALHIFDIVPSNIWDLAFVISHLVINTLLHLSMIIVALYGFIFSLQRVRHFLAFNLFLF